MEQSEKIESTAFRLIKPYKFQQEFIEHEYRKGEVVVNPSLISVCHADLRYFTGRRRKEAMDQKLPMALFHEGIGKIEKSTTPEVKVGEKVVVVPNISGYQLQQIDKSECCDTCKSGVSSNYCEQGVFMGSGYDGLGQSRLVVPSENVIPIPENVPNEIAVLSELCSVSVQAISRLTKEDFEKGKIAVFGDGPVGYLTAAMLHYSFHIPKERLIVFGAVKEKLHQFDFANQHLVHEFNFKEGYGINVIIECTGGPFSESAINQAINVIERNGKLIILGVTEELVPINTRDILEKGITVIGSSRSTVDDYKWVMKAFENEQFQKSLSKLVPNSKFRISNPKELEEAMVTVETEKKWQKAYLDFKW